MVSKCLILDAITQKKRYRFSFLWKLSSELSRLTVENNNKKAKFLCCFMNLHSLCNHMLIVMCSILNISFHSFIIHSAKNLSWKQRDTPPSSIPTNQDLLPACELILESAGVQFLTGLWSQPAVCVCQRADVTRGNEGWTLGLESQPSPSLQKEKVFLFLSSTDIT